MEMCGHPFKLSQDLHCASPLISIQGKFVAGTDCWSRESCSNCSTPRICSHLIQQALAFVLMVAHLATGTDWDVLIWYIHSYAH